MSTLSHSSTTSQAAEALLNRARRLSSNAYERTRPPTTFAEGEDGSNYHISHYDSLRPRSSNMPILLHRSSTGPSSLSNPLSTTASTSQTTMITSTRLIVSDAEGISFSPTDRNPSQVSTPEGPNHTSSSSYSNTFLDPNRAHTLPCTTSTLSSQSTRLTSLSATTSRPRALTLEAIREVRDPESPKDQHRKHRSENGGSLVRDILVVLRQSTELELPIFNHRHTTDLTINPDHDDSSSLPSSMSPEQKRQIQKHSTQTAVEECEHHGRSNPASRKSTLSPNQQISHPSSLPLKVEMASKSNSDLTTFFKHVPESETDKFQTTVGEPSIEAILPPGLPGYGVDGGSVSSADETKEIKSTTTIITPDHASALSSDYSLEDEDGSIDTAQEEEKEAIALSAFEPLSSSLTAAEPLERTKSSSKNSIFPSTSTGSMLERVPSRKEGKEGKGAFLLHRIGVRKNSFTESTSPASTAAAAAALSPMDGGSSDTSSIRSQSTQHSTGSGSGLPQHRLSKRSTKLLGKFVPKFLQTSLSPSLSTPGNNTSPHLQTVGLSTRSSRSGSMSGQSHSATNKTFSADGTSTRSSAPSSNKSSRESLVLDTTHDMNSLSPGHTHMDATSPQYLEFLRSDTHISPSLMARRSSCSSVTSKMSGNSFGSKPSASSVSSFDPSESNEFRRHSGSTKGDDIMCAFEVEYDEDNVEEDQEVEEIAAAAAAAAMNADQTVNDDEDPPLSPYIIDEDCDDDFFLNSVLRKKSNPSMTTDYNEQQCGFTPVMMSSYSSGTTMSSIHSSATTPSLSGRSSTSSQASTPSPTSPLLLNGQVYPFPIIALPPAASSAMGMKSPSNTTMHHHYRSNPLPPPIKLGLDEKRSRLRDAVGEWRRSANISN